MKTDNHLTIVPFTLFLFENLQNQLQAKFKTPLIVIAAAEDEVRTTRLLVQLA